jgi:hypothetical protein
MKPCGSQGEVADRSVPELIKQLWQLYLDMSLDPVLADSAEHIKQAVLTLETTRRLAHQVALEGQGRRSGGKRRKAKAEGDRQSELDWHEDGRPASHTKH